MKFVARVAFFLVDYMPLILGISFVAVMLVAGCAAAFASPAWAWTILRYGWKSYLALVGITLVVMMTFTYQNCCVGMQSFWDHLRHAGTARHVECLAVAALWPYGWFMVDQNMRGWGMSYIGIVLNALHYWFIEVWRGVRLECGTVKDGGVEKVVTTYVSSSGK